MNPSSRQDQLFAIANRGVGFEAWRKTEETQFILLDLQREAEVARERCTELSTITELKELQEAQLTVKMFKLLVDKINGYVHAGMVAEQELQKPETFED